jgi:Arc/MetJ-type ribon-helix-helix transcriptional regulator
VAPVSPRRIEFEELISVLIAEHVEIRKELTHLKKSVESREFSSAAEILRELDRLFLQHIADEEAQVLRMLIDAFGVRGADEAITVFRQHRPIYQLMEEVKKLPSLSPEELAVNEARLRSLLEEHTKAEEDRVFPKAVSTYKERGNNPSL